MIPVATVMACPHLAAPAALMVHVAQVESSLNPFAIGVVGGRLVRQPANLAEAIATAQMLETKGYNFSVGIAQVNRSNFGKYGLDTYQKAFSTCDNLVAASHILAQCYANAHEAWGKTFSCYNSGNFTTGFSNGYVQKVFATFDNGPSVARTEPATSRAIPLVDTPPATGTQASATVTVPHNHSAYRIAIRTSALDAVARAAVVPAVAAISRQPTPPVTVSPLPQEPAQPVVTSASTGQSAAGAGKAQLSAVFEPQVTGPGDAPRQASAAQRMPASVHVSAAISRDSAFVF